MLKSKKGNKTLSKKNQTDKKKYLANAHFQNDEHESVVPTRFIITVNTSVF